MTDAVTPSKKTKERSPSFPFIPLDEALKRVEAFEQTFGRHPAPAAKSGLAWGMKEGSSQAFQTLAALKAFGLVKYEGSAKERTAHLTDEARTYLRAQQQSIKSEVVRGLALQPAQIQKFWTVWGADRPPDPICLDDLVLKHAFTDNAARTFLSVYDNTIAFAGLSNSDTVDLQKEDALPFSVGDKINWISGDQIQFRTPVTVTEISSDEDGNHYLRVEGGELEQAGWVPMDQAIAADEKPGHQTASFAPPKGNGSPARREPESPPADETEGRRKAVFPIESGDVTLYFPKGMGADDFDELAAYMEIFLNREKRKSEAS